MSKDNPQQNLLNTAFQKTDMKNKYGAQPGCITVYVTARGGWPGGQMNLTGRHEYKVTAE
jgi:hypothetical protein